MGYRILHWGPLVALGIIASITLTTINCHLEWWPLRTFGAFVDMTVFLAWNALTLYNFFRAAFVGPGHTPYGWEPKSEGDTRYLQYCSICDGYKTPRSHHCRKCQRCVMKMDHHCPWINNCVGHFNHVNFLAFLFFAPCGCIHSLFILLPSIYRAIYRNYYLYYGTGDEPLVNLGGTGLISAMLSVGLAFGVIIAVGGLFFIQLRSIVKNETGIESWIKDKAEYRDRDESEGEFVYPYYLGRWQNLRMVVHWKKRPELDGIWWPVREGCNQYTLTMEQIQQKKEKRSRSVIYNIARKFNGSICPLSFGPRVCCCPPCMDEQRIRLMPGDRVLVSRFRKHWLYGEKLFNNESLKFRIRGKRERGWFPRKCGVKTSICEDEPHNGAHVTNGSAAPSPVAENNAIGDHSDVQQVRTNAKKNK